MFEVEYKQTAETSAESLGERGENPKIKSSE